MALFGNKAPIILKEGSDARVRLAALEALRGTLPPLAEKQLEADIRAVKAGITGEERVLYELKNSHMEMYVLQDLFLEHNGLTAQIDFLVITPQRSFVLECKNLYGDITITDQGDFIRSFGGRKREGIYSPITQNQRHLELIRDMRKANKSIAMNLILNSDENDRFRSFVVLANPKTVLNAKNASPEIRKMIIRADQLIATIKAVNDEKGSGRDKLARSAMQGRAEWFLSQHKENPVDYAARYREMQTQQTSPTLSETPANNNAPVCPRCGSPMVLRTARRGANAGKQFYGCSAYPNCRGTISISD